MERGLGGEARRNNCDKPACKDTRPAIVTSERSLEEHWQPKAMRLQLAMEIKRRAGSRSMTSSASLTIHDQRYRQLLRS